MKKAKQTTLFQSWKSAEPSTSNQHQNQNIIDLCDEADDDLLLAAAESEGFCEELNYADAVAGPSNNAPTSHPLKSTASRSLFQTVSKQPQSQARIEVIEPPTHQDEDKSVEAVLATLPCTPAHVQNIPGFDQNAGRLWIYPTNYPVREYQFRIVEQAIFKNTMVVLPTGLGKTFIAAVVMYNFYLWYPQGKIVFMAPTKPLVAQQIEACYNIMGIPQSDTAEMTGELDFYATIIQGSDDVVVISIYISRCHATHRKV